MLCGGKGTFSLWHKDGPMHCGTLILVLEGSKKVGMKGASTRFHRHFLPLIFFLRSAVQIAWTYNDDKNCNFHPVLDENWLASSIRQNRADCMTLEQWSWFVVPGRSWHTALNLEGCLSLNVTLVPLAEVPTIVCKTIVGEPKYLQSHRKLGPGFGEIASYYTHILVERAVAFLEGQGQVVGPGGLEAYLGTSGIDKARRIEAANLKVELLKWSREIGGMRLGKGTTSSVFGFPKSKRKELQRHLTFIAGK